MRGRAGIGEAVEAHEDRGAHRAGGHVARLRARARRPSRSAPSRYSAASPVIRASGDVGLGELERGHDVQRGRRPACRPRSRRRRGPGRARPPRHRHRPPHRHGRGRRRRPRRAGRRAAARPATRRPRRRPACADQPRELRAGDDHDAARRSTAAAGRGRGGGGTGWGWRSSSRLHAQRARGWISGGVGSAARTMRAALRPGSVRPGEVREAAEERLVVPVHAVAGRDHEVREQRELGVDDVVTELPAVERQGPEGGARSRTRPTTPSVRVSSSGSSTLPIADTSPPCTPWRRWSVRTLPIALSTVGHVVLGGASDRGSAAGS